MFTPSKRRTQRLSRKARSLTISAMNDYPAQPARSLPAPSVGGQKPEGNNPLRSLGDRRQMKAIEGLILAR